jgi:hypothetical protein
MELETRIQKKMSLLSSKREFSTERLHYATNPSNDQFSTINSSATNKHNNFFEKFTRESSCNDSKLILRPKLQVPKTRQIPMSIPMPMGQIQKTTGPSKSDLDSLLGGTENMSSLGGSKNISHLHQKTPTPLRQGLKSFQ